MDTTSTLGELWAARRAGARNISGVRYQLLLSLHLLVESVCGRFRAAAITPEGLEDIETDPTEGSPHWFVQAKERASATDTLGISDFADFLEHALPVLRQQAGAHAALITNASFSGDLPLTGWDQSIGSVLPAATRSSFAEAIQGLAAGELDDLLTRVSLITVPINLTRLIHQVAQRYGIAPAIADIVLNRILARLEELADEQAHKDRATAAAFTLTDFEEVVRSVIQTVAAANLPPETLTSLVEPLTFTTPASTSVEEFLSGVDVDPGHITAGLDVQREAELKQVAEGLGSARIALIVGPSGAGKSALLWRTAFDLRSRMRIWRLRRLTQADLGAVIACVRLHEPSEQFPILLCADDLGRPAMDAWVDAARALMERPGVYLVGAAREEDFTADLGIRRATIVRPRLDRMTATQLAQRLREKTVPLRMSVDEAFPKSKGLFMEFMHLLTQGRRLEAVIEDQVAACLSGDRRLDRDLLRYVTAAHTLGLPGVRSDVLQARFESGGDISAVLNRFQQEHLLVEQEEGVWSGLHLLRSTEIVHQLHKTPPPTLMATIVEVLEDADASKAALRLPSAIRLTTARPQDLVALIGRRAREGSAQQATLWLEQAGLADAVAHARGCIDAVRQPGVLPPTTDVISFLHIAHAQRFLGIDFSGLPNFDLAAFSAVADRLPERAVNLRRESAQQSDSAAWSEKISAASREHGIRLLEVLEGQVAWTVEDVPRILGIAWDDLQLDARRVGSVFSNLADDEAADSALHEIGSTDDRIRRVLDLWPLVTAAEVKDDNGSLIASSRCLQPLDGKDPEMAALDVAYGLLDLLPEIDRADVTIIRFDGKPLELHGRSGPHKTISREHRYRLSSSRWNRAFDEAVERELAYREWTSRIATQARLATTATQLVFELGRLVTGPLTASKVRRWESELDVFKRDVATFRPEPGDEEVRLAEPGDAPRSSTDRVKSAFSSVDSALRQVPAHVTKDGRLQTGNLIGCGSLLRKASQDYREALQRGVNRLSGVPEPFDPDLRALLENVATLLIAASRTGGNLPARPPNTVNVETLRDLSQAIQTVQLQNERLALEALAGKYGVHWTLSYSASTASGQLYPSDGTWLVSVPAEDWVETVRAVQETLYDETLQDFAFRLVMALEKGGQVPRAFGLRRGASRLFPLEFAALQELVEGAGMTLSTAADEVALADGVEALIRASRVGEASKLTAGASQASGLRRRADEELAKALESFDKIQREDLRNDLTEILGIVREQIDGANGPSLASEVDDVVVQAEPGELVQRLFAAQVMAALLD